MDVDKSRRQTLAVWAADCAARVLAAFEADRPLDDRPRRAIDAARAWARGDLGVARAREAAFAAHAAAREARREASRHAARAAAHAAATAHVAAHAPHAATYAVKSAAETAGPVAARAVAELERAWQNERRPEDFRSAEGSR